MLSLPSKISSKIIIFFGATLKSASAFCFVLSGDFTTVNKVALENNTEFKRVYAELQEYEAVYSTKISSFLPRLGVESRYETFDSEFEKVKGATNNIYADWNVFNGFKDYSLRKSAFYQKEQKRLEFERFKSNFSWKVKKIYAKAYASQETLKVYEIYVQKNQLFLQTVRNRRSSGLATDSDFLEFELFDSKLKMETMSAQSKFQQAFTELKALTGAHQIDKLTSQLPVEFVKIPAGGTESLLNHKNSKINSNRLSVEEADSQNSLAKAGYLPEVSLKATYGSMGLRETLVSPETYFGITARWEFFSGFETYQNHQASIARLLSAEAKLKDDQIRLQNELEQTFNQLKNIKDRILYEEKNLARVERYLNSVSSEYRRGVKNAADIKSAMELAIQSISNRLTLVPEYFEQREIAQDILGYELETEK